MQAACEIAHLKTLVESQDGQKQKLSAQALSAELVKLGLVQVTGSGSSGKHEDEDCENGSLSSTFVGQALNVHKSVLSQPRCVELLMDLESRFGTRSCFHSMSKLHVLAQKPTSVKSRVWVLESLHDLVCHGSLKVGDITRSLLQGDRTHCGMIALFETKQKVAGVV